MFNYSNMKIEGNKHLATHHFQIPNLHTKKKVNFEQKKQERGKERQNKYIYIFCLIDHSDPNLSLDYQLSDANC